MRKWEEIASALIALNARQVNELAFVMKPDDDIASVKEIAYKAEYEKECPSSPKQYGVSLLNKRRRKNKH